MSSLGLVRKSLLASPLLAAIGYAVLLLALLIMAWTSVAGILDQRADVRSSRVMLEQLEGHHAGMQNGQSDDGLRTGSPFLEGATVTIASATLIQRVAGAVAKFGGNVLSTQVEPAGPTSRAGFVSVLVSCEIDQVGLQPLLYNLEAGMPFLFVDQLQVQAPGAEPETGSTKLRVLLEVSGQWMARK